MKKEECSKRMAHWIEAIDILTSSVNDYIYVYDLQHDCYYICSSALDRFPIKEQLFRNVAEAHRAFVNPEDYDLLAKELADISMGKLEYHNLQYRWLDKRGYSIWINCRGKVLKDAEGKPEILVGCINEIGRSGNADNNSGLLGIIGLKEKIDSRKEDLEKGYILYIGIDNFKEINENKGLEFGNLILKKTAESIKAVLGNDDMLFHMQSDEFVVLNFSETDRGAAETLFENIRRSVAGYIRNSGYEVFFTVSAGILFFDDVENYDSDNILKLAEFALSRAKVAGKDQFVVYRSIDYFNFLKKKETKHFLRKAVNNEFVGFQPYFQPIVNIKDHKFHGAEALLRFKSDQTGAISPVEFIPMLEESGLIIPVGRWMIEQAFGFCKEVRSFVPDFRISVNVSYVQVTKSNVLNDIIGSLRKYLLPSDAVTIEITESGMLEQNDNYVRFISGLKRYGIPIAIDDFGTGYSNFHYLSQLNPNTLKFDRSFTVQALESEYEYGLLKNMVDLSHGINLKTCIEGIESEDELARIKEISPDFIQGYYFGRPCDRETFLKYFINGLKE